MSAGDICAIERETVTITCSSTTSNYRISLGGRVLTVNSPYDLVVSRITEGELDYTCTALEDDDQCGIPEKVIRVITGTRRKG